MFVIASNFIFAGVLAIADDCLTANENIFDESVITRKDKAIQNKITIAAIEYGVVVIENDNIKAFANAQSA